MYTNQVRSEFRYLCGWFPAEKKKNLSVTDVFRSRTCAKLNSRHEPLRNRRVAA